MQVGAARGSAAESPPTPRTGSPPDAHDVEPVLVVRRLGRYRPAPPSTRPAAGEGVRGSRRLLNLFSYARARRKLRLTPVTPVLSRSRLAEPDADVGDALAVDRLELASHALQERSLAKSLVIVDALALTPLVVRRPEGPGLGAGIVRDDAAGGDELEPRVGLPAVVIGRRRDLCG